LLLRYLVVLLLGAAVVYGGMVACSPELPIDESIDTWDLTEGRGPEMVAWGLNGWQLGPGEQYKAPATLRILLPSDREIQGRFGIVRVAKLGDELSSVIMVMEPKTALEAKIQIQRFLKELRAGPAALEKLDKWYAGGPKGQEGEMLIINLLEGAEAPFVSLTADWVWHGDSGQNWVVTASLHWLPIVVPSTRPPSPGG
jgi:hypothetical protein